MTKWKRATLLLSCLTLLTSGTCYSNNNAPEQEVASEEVNIQLISEAFGHFIGRNLKSPGASFDLESVIVGIRNGASGKAAPMSDQDYEIAMTKLQEQAFETMAKENLEAANTFMKENISTEGVKEIEPGKLQYSIIELGEGNTVEEHSSPLIHYTGKYLDGTVFGCSEEVGGPITIPLDQTIPGFSKGLLGMKEGEKRRLYIHPELGYGTLGNLPPNALLVFDIEVIKANATDDNQQEEELALLDETDEMEGFPDDDGFPTDGDDQETNLPPPDDMESQY